MKLHNLIRCAALLSSVALAAPLFAKPVNKNITITHTAKVGKADLSAGEYHLKIDGNKAVVQKAGHVIAEADGRWEDRASKSSYDAVLIGDDGQVKEVRFAGEARVFVFSE